MILAVRAVNRAAIGVTIPPCWSGRAEWPERDRAARHGRAGEEWEQGEGVKRAKHVAHESSSERRKFPHSGGSGPFVLQRDCAAARKGRKDGAAPPDLREAQDLSDADSGPGTKED